MTKVLASGTSLFGGIKMDKQIVYSFALRPFLNLYNVWSIFVITALGFESRGPSFTQNITRGDGLLEEL